MTVTIQTPNGADVTKLPLAGGTMSGAITLSNQADAVKTGDCAIQMKSYKTDGAGVSAYVFDTNVGYVGAGAKPYVFNVGATEAMWLGAGKGAFGGTSNAATGGYCFGQQNTASASYTTCFGYGNTSSGNGVITAGLSNNVAALYGVGLGFSNTVSADAFFGGSIGSFNNVTGSSSYAIGASNTIAGTSAYAVGQSNTVNGVSSVCIGKSNTTNDTSVAIGNLCLAEGNGTAVGYAAIASATSAFALGTQSQAAGDNAFVVGNGIRNSIADSVMFGSGTITNTANLAFLSAARSNIDTTRLAIGRNTSVGSTEYVTNGTFTGSATGWTLGADWSYSSNKLIKAAGASSGTVSQTISGLTIGKIYCLAYKMTLSTSADKAQYLTPSLTGGQSLTFGNRYQTMISAHKEVFIATATSFDLVFTPTGSTMVISLLDDISIKEVTGGNLHIANTLYANTDISVGYGTPTDIVNIRAGTTTKAQIHFADSTLKTSPTAGDLEYSSGHLYLTNGARHALSSSAGVKTSNTTVANTTTETTLYSYTFAANELHADEKVVFDISGVYSNASGADDFTIRVKVGGTTVHTVSRVGGNQTNAGWNVIYEGTIRTAGASGTFVDFVKFFDNEKAYLQADTTTHSVDTTGTALFEVTIQWAAAKAGNTFTATQGHLTFHH